MSVDERALGRACEDVVGILGWSAMPESARGEIRDVNRRVVQAYLAHEVADRLGYGSAPTDRPTDLRPAARSTDPSTSKRAARENAPRAGSQREAVLNAVLLAGHGVISDEVRHLFDGAWKRLSELEQGGWLYTHGERVSERTGKAQRVYRPTAKALTWWG